MFACSDYDVLIELFWYTQVPVNTRVLMYHFQELGNRKMLLVP